MKKAHVYWIPLALLLIASMIFTACQPAPATPSVIKETSVVRETVVVTEQVKVEVEKLITATPEAPPEVVLLRFYFPVGVAGSLAPKMDAKVKKFNDSHPNIQVEPIFAGNYPETFQKALTANAGGNPPDVALMADQDVWSLIDADAITPIDEYIQAAGGDAYMSDFYEAFVKDVTIDGHYWGLPFQKSTPVFYWNKDAFTEAGLDPEKPPETWTELLDYAQKLTVKDASGNVTRYGVEIPIDAWILSAFAFQNGMDAVGDSTEVYLDDPRMVEALQFIADLANKYQAMPQKRLFGDSGADFVAGQTAMLYNSTGSLTFIKDSATFDFGVAFLPGNVRRAAGTGGGPLVMFKNIPDSHKDAVWTFMDWMSSTDETGNWMVDTGYVSVRKSAVESPGLAEYIAGFPASRVAIDQLEYAIPQPPRTREGRKIFEIITTAFEDAMFLRGEPADLLTAAQAQAEEVLAKYK